MYLDTYVHGKYQI